MNRGILGCLAIAMGGVPSLGADVLSLRRALAQDVENAQLWYEKALAEEAGGRLRVSQNNLKRAALLSPSDVLYKQIRRKQIAWHLRQDETSAVVRLCQDLFQRFPQDDMLRRELMEQCLAEGLVPEVVAFLRTWSEQTASEEIKQRCLGELGELLEMMGHRAESLKAFVRAMVLADPEQGFAAELYRRLSKGFRLEGDLLGLAAFVDERRREYPNALAWAREEAALLVELREEGKAVAAYEALFEKHPDAREEREAYIRALVDWRKSEAVLVQTQILAERFPEDAELALLWAKRALAVGDEASRVEAVRAYLSRSNASEEAYQRVIRWLLAKGMEADARAMTGAYRTKHSASLEGVLMEARFLHEQGEREEALTLWRMTGEGEDRDVVRRVAREMALHGEHGAVVETLQPLADAAEPAWDVVRDACVSAIELGQWSMATPWIRTLVRLSDSPSALEEAIQLGLEIGSGQTLGKHLLEELHTADSLATAERWLLARLLDQRGDRDAAANVLERLEAEEALGVHQWIALHRSRGHWDEAARVLEGSDLQDWELLAALHRRAGDDEGYFRTLETWRAHRPDDPAPWHMEAARRLERQEASRAVEVLREGVVSCEEAYGLKDALVTLLADEGYFEEAMNLSSELYEEASSVEEGLSQARRLVRLADAEGRERSVRAWFEELHQESPELPLPRLSLAVYHRWFGDEEAVKASLAEFERMAGEDVEVLLALAQLAEDRGMLHQRETWLRQAVALSPEPRTWGRLGRALAGTEEGRTILERGILQSEKEFMRSGAYSLGHLAIAEGWKTVVRALEEDPDRLARDYRFAYSHAVALFQSGETTAARRSFLRLLTVERERRDRPLRHQADIAKPIWDPSADRWSLLRAYHQRDLQISRENAYVGLHPPNSLQELRADCLHFLRYLGKEDPKSMTRAISACGIRDASLFMLDPRQPWPSDVMKRYADLDRAELARLRSRVDGRGEHAQKEDVSFADRKEESPLQALRMLARDRRVGGDAEARVREALALAQLLQEPALQPAVVDHLLEFFSENVPDHLGHKLGNVILERVRRFPGKGRARSTQPYLDNRREMVYGARVFDLPGRIAKRLLSAGQFEAGLTVLDEHMDLGEMAEMSVPGLVLRGVDLFRFRMSERERRFLGPPWPSWFRDLGRGAASIESVRRFRGGWVAGIDSGEIAKLVPRLKSPLLRAQLWHLLEDEEMVSKEIEQWRSASAPEPHLLLASGWHAFHAGDVERASNDFARARQGKVTRRSEDWEIAQGLVACGLALGKTSGVPWERARKAAWRVGLEHLQLRERDVWRSIMESLGWEPANGWHVRVLPSQSVPTRGRLVNAALVDSAWLKTVVLGEWPGFLRQGGLDGDRRFQRQLELQGVNGPDGLEGRRLAVVDDWMGNRDEAVTRYRLLLEENPHDHPVRGRLAILLATEDPEAACELLLEMPWQQVDELLKHLYQSLGWRREMRLEERFQLVEMGLIYLERRSNEPAPWVTTLLDTLASGLEERGRPPVRVPSLFHTDPSVRMSDTRSRRARARRDRLHRQWSEWAVRDFPALRPWAFKHLAHWIPPEQREGKRLATMAIELLLGAFDRESEHRFGSAVGLSRAGAHQVLEDYLLAHAKRRHSWAWLEKAYLSELRRRGRVAEIPSLRERWENL